MKSVFDMRKTPPEKMEIARLGYLEGKSCRELAKEIGVSHWTVARWLHKAGVKLHWQRQQWQRGQNLPPD